MRTRALPTFLYALLGVVLFAAVGSACGTATTQRPDAGDGARDGGPSDAGDADDGGDPANACDVRAQDCAKGHSCLRFVDDGGVFATACLAGECDVLEQACGPGSKCAYAPAADGGEGAERRCVPRGDAGLDEGCSSTLLSDTCVAGHVCLPVLQDDGGMGGACRRYCYRDEDCPDGQLCVLLVEPEGSAERPSVCDTPCDLLAQDCPGGRGCYPSSIAPGCFEAGTSPVGGSCTFSDECVPGAACTFEGACVPLCAIDGSGAGCSSGSCTAIGIPNAPDVGACL